METTLKIIITGIILICVFFAVKSIWIDIKELNERYFFVSYSCIGNKNNGFGNVHFSLNEFPSNNFLKESISDIVNCKHEDIVIINISEFESKKDFESFRK